MKKLLFGLTVLLLSSCTTTLDKTITNPQRETTLEILNSPMDTVLITELNTHVYILKDNMIIGKTVAINNDTIPVNIFYIVITTFMAIFLIIIFLVKILE